MEKKTPKPHLALDLTLSATVFVRGKCADCGGPDCPVCHGKGEAIAVFTVEQIADMAIGAALAQSRADARKPKLVTPPTPKIARLN